MSQAFSGSMESINSLSFFPCYVVVFDFANLCLN